jgi:AraC-like DNA-binding protein
MPAHAARQNEKREFYDRWSSTPSEKLASHAADLILNNGNLDSAYIYLNVVYNRYVEDPNDKKKQILASRALNNMGYLMFFYYFDYERAYTYLSESLELAKKNNYNRILPYIYVNLGNLKVTQSAYVNTKQEKDALPYYKKGFYLAAKFHDWEALLVNFANMVSMVTSLTSYLEPESISKEVAYFDKLRIPAETKGLAFYRQMSLIYKDMAKGMFNNAITQAAASLPTIPNGPDSLRFVATVYNTEASCMMRMGRYKDAVTVLNEQLRIVQAKGIKDLVSETYYDLMTVCKKMGNQQLTHHYEYLYLKSKDEMLIGRKIANLEQTRLMIQLNKTNEEVKAAARRVQLLKWGVMIALVFILTVTIFSIALIRRNRNLRESYHKLYQTMQDSLGPKTKKNTMDNQLRKEIIDQIEDILSNLDELCREDMSLSRLSELTGLSQKLISQAINEQWQKSFPQLLAEYRIREACRRMQDPDHYGSFTIEGIGQSVGFHTRSNFFATFKRITGLTPTEYIREANRSEALQKNQ